MKYFVISDVHSYYDEMMAALASAGFDENDPNHMLIMDGDLMDRGPKTVEVIDYAKRLLDKGKVILIMGNHEYNMIHMLKRGIFDETDYSNGTAKSAHHLAGDLSFSDEGREYFSESISKMGEICDKAKKSGIIGFIQDNFRDYAETKTHIITHAWIPLKMSYASAAERFGVPADKSACRKWWPTIDDIYYAGCGDFVYVAQWRKASPSNWEVSTWGPSPEMYDQGNVFPKGKKLVIGHYHCSEFNFRFKKDEEPRSEYSDSRIFDDGKNLAAIDACTAYSGRCNVYVFEERDSDISAPKAFSLIKDSKRA